MFRVSPKPDAAAELSTETRLDSDPGSVPRAVSGSTLILRLPRLDGLVDGAVWLVTCFLPFGWTAFDLTDSEERLVDLFAFDPLALRRVDCALPFVSTSGSVWSLSLLSA